MTCENRIFKIPSTMSANRPSYKSELSTSTLHNNNNANELSEIETSTESSVTVAGAPVSARNHQHEQEKTKTDRKMLADFVVKDSTQLIPTTLSSAVSAAVAPAEEIDSGIVLPTELCGYLSKWTNYIHGWQHRYFVLKDSIFSYFKSQEETSSGCRGAIHIGRAEIRTYDFDTCRFDVTVNDTYWHLRASGTEERDRWLDAIAIHRSALEVESTSAHRRSPSLLSLQSVLSDRSCNNLHSTSVVAPSSQNNSAAGTTTAEKVDTNSAPVARLLQERTLELLAFRNLLMSQLDDVQGRVRLVLKSSSSVGELHANNISNISSVMNVAAAAAGNGDHSTAIIAAAVENTNDHLLRLVQQDLSTFRTTAQSMLQTVTSCCELFAQYEQTTVMRLEREKQKRAKVKHAYQHVCDKLQLVTSEQQRAVLQHNSNSELIKPQRVEALVAATPPATSCDTTAYSQAMTTPTKTGEFLNTGTIVMPVLISGTTKVTGTSPAATTTAISSSLFGPDFQEGPHARINEDEFYDAIDAALDREEAVDAEETRQKAVYERLQSMTNDAVLLQQQIQLQQQQQPPTPTVASPVVANGGNAVSNASVVAQKIDADADTPQSPPPSLETFPSLELTMPAAMDRHLAHLPQEISQVLREQYDYALQSPNDGVWQLFVEEGDMRMYRREIEEGGLPVDPLKALNTVQGVTAREITYYFFAPETRMEWETTVDKVDVVVSLSESTKIFYQVHKRVWPTAQRESLFWSHIRREPDLTKKFDTSSRFHLVDSWIVCNKSIELDDIPCGSGRVRVGLKICMVGQTFVPSDKRHVPLEQLSRSNVHTRLAYCAIVNPGGWVPAAGMRQVYKREYPRFLRKFTKYVSDKVKSKPLMWQ